MTLWPMARRGRRGQVREVLVAGERPAPPRDPRPGVLNPCSGSGFMDTSCASSHCQQLTLHGSTNLAYYEYISRLSRWIHFLWDFPMKVPPGSSSGSEMASAGADDRDGPAGVHRGRPHGHGYNRAVLPLRVVPLCFIQRGNP